MKTMLNLLLQFIGIISIVTGFNVLECVVFVVNCKDYSLLVQNIWKIFDGKK